MDWWVERSGERGGWRLLVDEEDSRSAMRRKTDRKAVIHCFLELSE